VFLAAATAGFFAVTGGQALASHVTCGDTITTATTLDSDLVACPNNGIVIGADDITLDLNGHTIDGDGELKEACADDETCDVGVVNAGHTRVTIEGGSVREFRLAILVVGASDNRLLNLSATRSIFSGVIIAGSPRVRFEHNAVTANSLDTDQAGVAVFDSPHSRIAHNLISDNGDLGVFGLEADDIVFEMNVLSGNRGAGILLEGDRNLFRRNRVSRSAEGITVGGDANTITRNHLSDLRAGPSGEGGGLGIFVAAGFDNLVERNIVARADRAGIQVSLLPEELEGGPPAVNTVVRDNHLRGNGDGVFVLATAENTLLEGNHAVGSEDDGIDVDSTATTLSGNHAVHNGDLGIEAVAGVTDGGGNKASGNGNPEQCTNIACT
jgi:parallel beta-helix repeat protein